MENALEKARQAEIHQQKIVIKKNHFGGFFYAKFKTMTIIEIMIKYAEK